MVHGLDRGCPTILPPPLVLVAVLTGMRWSELVALRWNDPRSTGLWTAAIADRCCRAQRAGRRLINDGDGAPRYGVG